jgi:hypothetical protein
MSDIDTRKAQLRGELQSFYADISELEIVAEEAYFQGDETNGYRMQRFSAELNHEARLADAKLLALITKEYTRR